MSVTKKITFSSIAIALALVTSYMKAGSLPFGGSITLFSMFFICFVGYLYGLGFGLAAGTAFGFLQLILNPFIFHPVQVLLDYPMAYGCLGLSGIFVNSRHGLVKGITVGIVGRYICHVISGYIFFEEYAGGTNLLLYTLGYNATYILPEFIATVVLISFPPVANGLKEVKKMAVNQ